MLCQIKQIICYNTVNFNIVITMNRKIGWLDFKNSYNITTFNIALYTIHNINVYKYNFANNFII